MPDLSRRALLAMAAGSLPLASQVSGYGPGTFEFSPGLAMMHPIVIDTDYFGKPRKAAAPSAGPFEDPGTGNLKRKVW